MDKLGPDRRSKKRRQQMTHEGHRRRMRMLRSDDRRPAKRGRGNLNEPCEDIPL